MKIVTFAEFGVNNVIFPLEKKNIVLYYYFITRDRIKMKISEHNRSTRVYKIINCRFQLVFYTAKNKNDGF